MTLELITSLAIIISLSGIIIYLAAKLQEMKFRTEGIFFERNLYRGRYNEALVKIQEDLEEIKNKVDTSRFSTKSTNHF